MRVLRVYHGGRSSAHRRRERGLVLAGVELQLVVPRRWDEGGAERELTPEPFPVRELAVRRVGDVNRHVFASSLAAAEVVRDCRPDVLDLHEEPFSRAAQQWLAAAPPDLPVVMYTAQNVDKRYPPPFDRYEHRSHRLVAAFYPCTKQAASVTRGKGFGGLLEVIPLGYDPELFRPGDQSLDADELRLALFGRLVPEKGVRDAVAVLARLNEIRRAKLTIVGSGPETDQARRLAIRLGVVDLLEIEPWRPAFAIADIYRASHVVLVPSVPTTTWTEQFGRVIVEAHASGAVVAGYATGSIPEVAGDTAVLVPGGDARGLAGAVAALVRDPDTFQELRQRGLALAAGRTWEAVARRQAELYRRVLAGDAPRVDLPRSPRKRREAARAEFGPTAPTIAGTRPFALPLLRKGGPLPAGLAAAIDVGAELKAAVQPRGG